MRGPALTLIRRVLLAQASRLIARDTTFIFPPEVEELPDVAYARARSPEGVLPVTAVPGAPAGTGDIHHRAERLGQDDAAVRADRRDRGGCRPDHARRSARGAASCHRAGRVARRAVTGRVRQALKCASRAAAGGVGFRL